MKNDASMQWRDVERLDWHVWLLAISLLLILGGGLLVFMFPSAFWDDRGMEATIPQRLVVGFAVLYALALWYMVQRQLEVRRLRRQLYEARRAVVETETAASKELLHALPGMGPFRDALAMEYRRASRVGLPLGAALLSSPDGSTEVLARIARFLCSTMRPGESLYRVGAGALAVILPRMGSLEVSSFVAQVESSGGLFKGEMEVMTVSYPSEVSSLSELEGKLRKLAQPEKPVRLTGMVAANKLVHSAEL